MPLYSFALSLNQELFIAVDRCDVDRIESLIKSGADTEARFNESIRPLVRIGVNENFTVLAYALISICHDRSIKIDDDNERFQFVHRQISKMIEILVKNGAKTDHKMWSGQSFSFPLLHIPFHSEFAEWTGGDYFSIMVSNGASPHLLDSRGRNALAVMIGLNEDQQKKVIQTGVSYMQVGPSGYSSAHLFPNFFSDESFQKKYMNELIEQGFNYSNGNFQENDFSHPIYRNLYQLFTYGDQVESNFKNLLKQLKEIMMPFMKPTWNIPSGELKMPVISQLLKMGCPRIEYANMISYSFGEKNTLSSDDSRQKMQVYDYIRSLIQTEEINLRAEDINGKDVLTYALNFCPFELVQDILKKEKRALTAKHINDSLSNFQGLFRDDQTSSFLNNDHRTFEFLIDAGMNVEGIDLKRFGVTNELMLKKTSKLKWKKLKDSGLDLEKGISTELVTSHIFKRFDDLKTNKISLNNLKGKKKFKFNGVPISVRFEGKSNAQRGLTLLQNNNELEFEVKNGIFYYSFKGGLEHSGTVTLSEIEENNEVVLILIETASLSQRSIILNFNDKIVLRNGEKINISRAKDILLVDDHSLRYEGFNKIESCESEICTYLKIEHVDNENEFLVLDESSLRKNNPGLYQIWKYLSIPLHERVSFLQEIKKSILPSSLSYFLDLVRASPQNLWQELEAINLLDLLINLELGAKLPFQSLDLINKLGQVSFSTEEGKSFKTSRDFILNGSSLEDAFNAVTTSWSRLEEYVHWSRSFHIDSRYQDRFDRLTSQIKLRLDEVAIRLNLSNTQIEDIKRSL